MKRHSTLKKIQKPTTSSVRDIIDMPQFTNSTNVNKLTSTCRCACKQEIRTLADGIARLERLASVQSKLITKIARRIHLDSDTEEDFEVVSPAHSDNSLCSITFPITTEQGLLELDNVLQDKKAHEKVVCVSYSNLSKIKQIIIFHSIQCKD